MVKYRIIIIIILLFTGTLSVLKASEWKLVLKENNICGYSRAVKGSDILEFRSTLIVNSKIEIVGAVLRNVEGLIDASEYCKESRFIQKKDKNNYIFYVYYDLPGIFTDRDIIVKVKTRYDFNYGRAISDLTAVQEPLVPLKKDCIRITDYKAQFVIEYITREKTGIIFTSRLDPGGYIPDFLVNYLNERALVSSAVDMKAAVKKEKYLKAVKKYQDVQEIEKIVNSEKMIKKILRNRLKQYVLNKEFITLLLNNDLIYYKLCAGKDDINEILLQGWDSQGNKEKVASVLLEQYFKLHIDDKVYIKNKINEYDLINMVIYNKHEKMPVKKIIVNYKKANLQKNNL